MRAVPGHQWSGSVLAKPTLTKANLYRTGIHCYFELYAQRAVPYQVEAVKNCLGHLLLEACKASYLYGVNSCTGRSYAAKMPALFEKYEECPVTYRTLFAGAVMTK